ncbi:MAG: DnaJ domain-containing protein [Desulfovibrionaceae bacterium]|nr:DnaJ domain-containing protein [Desulfovibrionaceae bacterium]
MTAKNLSLKDCYAILRVTKDASLDDVKHSYRVRAFELHPDLHPGDSEAAKNFQLLNEAYVTLSAVLKDKAKDKTQDKTQDKKSEQAKDTRREKAEKAYAEQDVLRDLLNDPFARRVFEDIYSELARKQEKKKEALRPEKSTEEKAGPKPKPKPNEPIHRVAPPKSMRKTEQVQTEPKEKGVGDVVKGWLKRQIDDEMTLSLPAASLIPGRRIRLQIRHGLSNDVRTIEVTIPRDYVQGKPIRLKGLGKHVGPWQGDLYLQLKGV